MKELKPIHSGQKSFCRKAFVLRSEGKILLHRYDTLVATITAQGNVFIHINKDEITATTLKHLKEFLLQEGFKAENKKQIYKDYYYNFEPINFHNVNNDTYGNPRYVVHFMHFINMNYSVPFEVRFEQALINAKKVGGSKYRGKDFGGGVVLQSYNKRTTEVNINKARLGLL